MAEEEIAAMIPKSCGNSGNHQSTFHLSVVLQALLVVVGR